MDVGHCDAGPAHERYVQSEFDHMHPHARSSLFMPSSVPVAQHERTTEASHDLNSSSSPTCTTRHNITVISANIRKR